MEPSPPGVLTHLDSHGAARMVDVADRPASNRAATEAGGTTSQERDTTHG